MTKRVVSLGEIMMRLSPPGYERFVQADTLDMHFGGGEANVVLALSNYGMKGVFVSKVPDTAIGQAAINHLRRYGVDTQFIMRGGARLGIYFKENGTSVRAPQVIYDRAGSSISEAEIIDFDFDKIFEGADWFHISGITPSLSEKAAALAEATLKVAKAKGIRISIDINFRKKLWSIERAREVMTKLCHHADVCIGPDACLGFTDEDADLLECDFDLERYKVVFEKMKKEFGFKYIASTLRDSHSASDNSLRALVYDGQEFYLTKKYDVRIVDRVGSGDSFASGFIYGLLTGMPMAESAEFGIAAAALKHTIPGDVNHASLDEVKALMNGDGRGLLKR